VFVYLMAMAASSAASKSKWILSRALGCNSSNGLFGTIQVLLKISHIIPQRHESREFSPIWKQFPSIEARLLIMVEY